MDPGHLACEVQDAADRGCEGVTVVSRRTSTRYGLIAGYRGGRDAGRGRIEA
jgi:hypothetical protein